MANNGGYFACMSWMAFFYLAMMFLLGTAFGLSIYDRIFKRKR